MISAAEIPVLVISLLLTLLLAGCRAEAQPPPAPGGSALPPGVHVLRNLEYARVGDRALLLDLYLPEQAQGPLPVVVWIHGGAWRAGNKEGTPAVRLVPKGYAVASISYRLSQEAVWPAQIQDCKAALRWLRAHAQEYGLDPDRFAAWGASAGGHLAAMLGTAGDAREWEVGENLGFSSRVQAVCDFFGPADFTTIGYYPCALDHLGPDSPEAQLIGASLTDHPDKARAASPNTYITADDPPFLIMHGDMDWVVPWTQSQELYDQLRAAGVAATLVIVPGAGHGFAGPEIDAQVDAFLDQHLKGITPPAPVQPAAGPAQPPPAGAYKPEPGPLGVAVRTDLVLHDAARNKDLRVVAVYPRETGAYPVLVFSHGFGASSRYYSTLSRYWASHGYVVLLPTHADSLSLRPGGENWIGVGEDIREMFRDPEAWVNRPKDVSFLLDCLPQLEEQAPDLAGKMDAEKIGVGGHSFGAYTAQVIGGATLTLPGQAQPVSLADNRVKAVLMLSGQGPGQMGLTDGSWQNFRLPAMSMTGSLDRGALGQAPEWRRRAFELCPPGDKYLVFIEGASHFSFNDLVGPLASLEQPQREAISGYIRIASLAFWDAYLKGEAAAKDYLQSDGLAEYGRGAVALSRR